MRRGRKAGVALAACLLALTVSAAWAADPTDRGFGSSGFVETPLSRTWSKRAGAPNIWDMAPVRGGFVGAIADLTTGQDVFGAVRYRRGGRLDRGFGENGFTRPLHLGNYTAAQAQAIAVERSGRIVVAGFRHGVGERTRALLARFRPDGSLDRSFGQEGVVLWRRRRRGLRDGALHDVAIVPGGRIVAVGASGEHGMGESSRYSAGIVTAYRSDGRLDRRFGENGQVLFPVAGGAEYTGLKTVRALPDGRLLVAGFHYGSLLLARLLPDGELDPSFGGGDGKEVMAISDEGAGCWHICMSATAIAIRPDGRLLVLSSAFPHVPAMVRLWPNGEPDRSFGKRGVVKVHLKRHQLLPFDMVLQRGRIVLVGWDEAGRRSAHLRFFAVRLLGDGRLDRSFGHHGLWIHRGAEFSGAFAALNQPGGRVVVAGGAEDKPESGGAYESFLQLARLLPR